MQCFVEPFFFYQVVVLQKSTASDHVSTGSRKFTKVSHAPNRSTIFFSNNISKQFFKKFPIFFIYKVMPNNPLFGLPVITFFILGLFWKSAATVCWVDSREKIYAQGCTQPIRTQIPFLPKTCRKLWFRHHANST